jgi:hypothetical protein
MPGLGEGVMTMATVLRETFRCDHCREPGTTAQGGLWKTSLEPHASLYYLHSGCVAPYKAARGLRSVEGRIPAAATARRGHVA